MEKVIQKGTFKFAYPFNEILREDVEYSIEADRSLLELANTNPLKSIYEPAGLTDADYMEDLKEGVHIIGLKSFGPGITYVPQDRITAGPLSIGIRYQKRGLAFSLGEIPVVEDLGPLIANLTDIVKDTSGINVTIQESVLSDIRIVPYDVNDNITDIRTTIMTNPLSYHLRYIEAINRITKLQEYIEILEQEIIRLGGVD